MSAVLNVDALASAIRTEHEAAQQLAREAVQHAIRAGELLLQAKAELPHGEFGPWLAANVAFAERTAQAYMKLAKLDPQKRNAVADLSLRAALKEIATEAPETPRPVAKPSIIAVKVVESPPSTPTAIAVKVVREVKEIATEAPETPRPVAKPSIIAVKVVESPPSTPTAIAVKVVREVKEIATEAPDELKRKPSNPKRSMDILAELKLIALRRALEPIASEERECALDEPDDDPGARIDADDVTWYDDGAGLTPLDVHCRVRDSSDAGLALFAAKFLHEVINRAAKTHSDGDELTGVCALSNALHWLEALEWELRQAPTPISMAQALRACES